MWTFVQSQTCEECVAYLPDEADQYMTGTSFSQAQIPAFERGDEAEGFLIIQFGNVFKVD